MPIRDYLIYMIRVNKGAAAGFFDTITDQESMDTIDGRFNHMRWLAGHMLYTMESMLPYFDKKHSSNIEMKEKFSDGTLPSESPDEYPPMAELVERIDRNYDQLIKLLSKASDADLERNIESDKPLWQSFAFLCMHDFYHMGQVMYHRRGLGKKWPWD